MYEPPRAVRLADGTLLPREQWRPMLGPDLDEVLPEQLPDGSQPPGWDFIHYDLDPQNGKIRRLLFCPRWLLGVR